MYRRLTPDEIGALRANGNRAESWDSIQVADPFHPELISDNRFGGSVRLGAFSPEKREPYLGLPEGVSHCWIRDAAIGDHCALHKAQLIDNYSIGSHATLFNIGQLTASTPFAMQEASVMNENGARSIVPFPGMTIGDAYLWAKYRNRTLLMQRLRQLTDERMPAQATIGDYAVIANTQRLHNAIILSHKDAPTVIAEAICIEQGVVGYGCRIERGCVLSRFLLGENVHIEDVARINDSVVGDNSTIARCEVGNSLIFPAHEQHHNNSFLIAAAVMGQSNVAAGATIGSNHNGRTADNELVARRGFWPGLCCSFKHPSHFASYCLAAKGDYPNELDITLPFSLISNNVSANRLEVMPAFWWMHNMYALHRNGQKFAHRDRRTLKRQHIEFTPLAPDTVEEIVCARELLRNWTEQAYISSIGKDSPIEVYADNMERGKRKVVILKAAKAYQAYEEMLYHYIGTALTQGTDADRRRPADLGGDKRQTDWVNIGGQLVARPDLDKLIIDIEKGAINSWDQVHQRMDELWEAYPEQKRRHAYALLCWLNGTSSIGEEAWRKMLDRYDETCRYVDAQVRACREKDASNPYRRMTFDNDEEMNAVLFA